MIRLKNIKIREDLTEEHTKLNEKINELTK